MTPKRKKAQDTLLKYIGKITGGGFNVEKYTELFTSMSDAEFTKFMQGLKDKTITLCVIASHDGSADISIENNFKIAKELGVEFFQRLSIKDQTTGERYMTPNRYLVYRLPIRKTAQLLTKGLRIPKNTRKVNMVTGQVTGPSRASMITMPETQLLLGMGLDKTVLELVKYRGGDLGAKNATANLLYKNGRIDAATLEQYSTGVVSSETLKNYFLGAHIRTEGLGK